MSMVGVIGLVLVVVVALCVIAALVARHLGFHVARIKSGLAFVVPSYGLDGEPVRVLRIGGGNQSATYLDDDWARPYGHYIEKFDLIFEAGIPIHRVLMLGGGGYSYPKHLLTTHHDVSIDVVEYDQAVTDLAWKYFYLDELEAYLSAEPEERLGLVTADGRSYLKACPKRYDAILNDTFQGNRPAKSLSTLQAVRQYKRHLNAGGVYVTNVIAALEGDGSKLLRDVVVTLQQEFAHVCAIPCWNSTATTVDNKLIVASDTLHDWPQAYRGNLSRGGEVLLDSQ